MDSGRGRRVVIETPPLEKPTQRSFSPCSDSSNPGFQFKKRTKFTTSNTLLAEAIREAENILYCLCQLADAIRRPITPYQLIIADRSFNPKSHEDFKNYLVRILLAKSSDFEKRSCKLWKPGANDNPADFGVDISRVSIMQQRLIDDNLRRRNRFMYAQRQASKRIPPVLPAVPVVDHKVIEEADQEVNTVSAESGTQQHSQETMPFSATRWRLPTLLSEITDTTASANCTPAPILNTSTPSTAMSEVSSDGSKLNSPDHPQIDVSNCFRCPCCCQALPAMFWERHHWEYVDFTLIPVFSFLNPFD